MDDWLAALSDNERPMLNGIIKCLLVPPHGAPSQASETAFYPPVIPMRHDDRLLFSYCLGCSKKFKVGFKDDNYFCPHFEWRDRAFVSTITSAELREALSVGYSVKKLYRCYYFTEWTNNLFQKYVRKFLTLKIHASGWPSGCNDIASRQDFMDKVLQDYDIIIDPHKMIANPGLRYIAKVCDHVYIVIHIISKVYRLIINMYHDTI
jgi:hypothetical protein